MRVIFYIATLSDVRLRKSDPKFSLLKSLYVIVGLLDITLA